MTAWWFGSCALALGRRVRGLDFRKGNVLRLYWNSAMRTKTSGANDRLHVVLSLSSSSPETQLSVWFLLVTVGNEQLKA